MQRTAKICAKKFCGVFVDVIVEDLKLPNQGLLTY